MDIQQGFTLFRVAICCSGGLYGLQGGCMQLWRVIMTFRRVIVEENNDGNSGH